MSTLDHTLKPEATSVRRLEVITGTGRRRQFSEDFKVGIVEETLVQSSVTSQVSMVTPSERSVAARRLVPNTRKPAFCNALAVAYPIPEDAPVIRATPGLVLFMEVTSLFVLESVFTPS